VKLREILALQMEMQANFEKMAVGLDLMQQNLNMEGMYSAIIILSMIPSSASTPCCRNTS